MEVVSEQSVVAVAQELGINADAVLSQVAAAVELRLRSLVADAATFMRRSKRQRLTAGDVRCALRTRRWPQLHGFAHQENGKSRFLAADGVFFVETEDVDLEKLLRDAEEVFLPRKVPLRPSFGVHWLAIDGIQPTVAENPRLVESQQGSAEEQLRSDPNRDIVKHTLTRELQIYFEKVVLAVVDAALGNNAAVESVFASLSADPGLQQLMPFLAKFIFDQVNRSLSNLPLLKSVMRLTRCILSNPNLDKELYLHEMMPPILTCIVHRRLCMSPFEDHWALRNFAATLIPQICSQYGSIYPDIKPRISKTLREALLNSERPMTTQYGAIVGLSVMGPLTIQNVLLPVMKRLLHRYYNAVVAAQQHVTKYTIDSEQEVLNGNAKFMKDELRKYLLMHLEAQNCIGAIQNALGSYLRACHSKVLQNSILLEEHMKLARAATVAAGEPCIPWHALSPPHSTHLQLFL